MNPAHIAPPKVYSHRVLIAMWIADVFGFHSSSTHLVSAVDNPAEFSTNAFGQVFQRESRQTRGLLFVVEYTLFARVMALTRCCWFGAVTDRVPPRSLAAG